MIEQLKEGLASGIVKFSYTKKDGTQRVAIGTTNRELIPKYSDEAVSELVEASSLMSEVVSKVCDGHINRSQFLTEISPPQELLSDALKPFLPSEKVHRKVSENVHSYYDFSVKGWRSFTVSGDVEILG